MPKPNLTADSIELQDTPFLADLSNDLEDSQLASLFEPAPHPSRQTLWLPITIALLLACLNITVGTLGALIQASRGPMSSVIIPVRTLRGRYINPPNIAALISGVVTLLHIGCGQVYAGLCRSWLWQQALQSKGFTVKRWRAAASASGGISLALLKSPFFGSGIVTLFCAVGAGLTAPAFQGILVPLIEPNNISGSIENVPGYAGNADVGLLVSRLDAPFLQQCALASDYGTISDAIKSVPGLTTETSHFRLSDSIWVSSVDSFLAGPVASASLYKIDPLKDDAAYDVTSESVGLKLETICAIIPDIRIDNGQFSYLSPCLSNRVLFGNAASGTWSTASRCINNDTWTLEYAFGGIGTVIPSCSPNANPYVAFTCNLTGSEGLVNSVIYPPNAYLSNFRPSSRLTAAEIDAFAFGIVVAMLRDNPVGFEGAISDTFAGDRTPDGSLDMAKVETQVGNAAHCAATVGYKILLAQRAIPGWITPHQISASYHYNAYGWTSRTANLVWVIISFVISLFWVSSAVYMARGGTTYDPTDCYQTIETVISSQIELRERVSKIDVDGTMLWYRQLDSGRMGFSETRP